MRLVCFPPAGAGASWYRGWTGRVPAQVVAAQKPLTDKDRSEIRKNIDDKVLRGQPIAFRSTTVRLAEPEGPLVVEGQPTMAGNTRPITAELDVGADGRLSGTIPSTQSEWGIKPYRGLMGALKVRDELEVVLDARLRPS